MGEWLARQRELARERGLTPLADTTVRAYIRMARFRHAHPDLAGAYLALEPWGLCAALTLPREVLAEYAKAGVPLKSGDRSPLADATVRELRWGARLARAKGIELPAEPEPVLPERRAPVSLAETIHRETQLLRQAGRLDTGQIEEVIGAVLEKAGVRALETTRRQIAVAIADAADASARAPAPSDRRTPAGAEVAERLEALIPAAGRAVALICAAVGRRAGRLSG